MNFPMVCTCHYKDVVTAEKRRLRIFERMKLRSMENLTTAIILSLAFDFGADVSLAADMWFGISLTTPLIKEDLYIECDYPEEGLAFLWEYLAKRFPGRVSVSNNKNAERHLAVAKGVSEFLLNSHIVADKRYRAFTAKQKRLKREYTDYQNDPELTISIELCSATKNLLLHEWGSDVMRPAIERAYSYE